MQDDSGQEETERFHGRHMLVQLIGNSDFIQVKVRPCTGKLRSGRLKMPKRSDNRRTIVGFRSAGLPQFSTVTRAELA